MLGTTPQKMPGVADRSRPVIQNLGPGNVYLDTDGDVDALSGFRIAAGGVYEFPTSGASSPRGIFMVADAANTDVRIVGMG